MQDTPNKPTGPNAALGVAPPAPPTPAVLYVDDEEQALKYFRKAMAKEFEVFTAPGVDQALAVLAEHASRIGVVISDQRMPGRTGVELLTEIRQRWPQMIRILLTAYADIESAVAAVNSGAIYKYLNKPADLDLLRKTLHEASALFRAQAERETVLRERMSELHRVIVADRVRSVAAMADGISHHLRNSMTAMSCFLEESGAPDARPGAATGGSGGYLEELWGLARAERESLIGIVQRVAAAAHAPTCASGQDVSLEALMRQAMSSVSSEVSADRIDLRLPTGLPTIKADADAVAGLFASLLRHTARRCDRGGKLTVRAEAGVRFWNTSAVRVSVVGQGGPWADHDMASLFTPFAFPSADPSDLGLELLLGCFVAYQHGGDVAVRQTSPDGPGFEVLLPTDPAAVRRPQFSSAAMGGPDAGAAVPPPVP